ncbi:hypothetical protein GCM10027586_00700 [Kineococcus gypseus]|uniref:glycoside hydrolase family 16 protein n=1 Tax=Kineococcus gypseus TaxID=1637102 RepID=UPI003D7DAFE5
MRTIDAWPPLGGAFPNSSGIGDGTSWFNGGSGDVGPAVAAFEAFVKRSRTWHLEYGRDQAGYQPQYSKGQTNRTVFSLQEHMKRAYGRDPGEGYTTQEKEDFWDAAARNVAINGHNLQDYALDMVARLVAAGVKYAPIRLARESGSNANEAPITSDTQADNAFQFYRRCAPLMIEQGAAGGLRLPMWWNPGGGPNTSYQNQMRAFPGWVDAQGRPLITGMAVDVYSVVSIGSVLPVFKMHKNVTLQVASAAGTTTIDRTDYQAPLDVGDVVTVGVGTANAETRTVSAVNGDDITFSTALSNPHAVGERITKQYAVGEMCHWYGQFFRSRVANNTALPSSFAQVTTTEWQWCSWTDLTQAQQADAITRWRKIFERSFYGKNESGVVDTYWYVQKWYDLARCIGLGNVQLNAALDPATARWLDFSLCEIGVMGRPNTRGPSSGDAWPWVAMAFAWSAAMKLRDGWGVHHWGWWNHDDGVSAATDVPRSVYSFGPPYGLTTPLSAGNGDVPPKPYHPQTGRTIASLADPGAQMRQHRRRGGKTQTTGGQPVRTPAPAVPAPPSTPAPAIGPSGQAAPTASLPGWTLLMSEDFTRDAALGSFKTVYGDAWAMDWGRDTSKNGGRPLATQGLYASPHTVSVSGSVLKKSLKTKRTEADAPDAGISIGTPLVASLTPTWGALGLWAQTYGRYAVRFRASQTTPAGQPDYKLAWLLWPAEPNGWTSGEIDFPEGGLGGTIEGYSHQVDGDPAINQWFVNTGTSMAAWHTCVIEWTPTVLRFILDGTVQSTTDARAIPKVPMYWNLQTETNLGATPPPVDATGTVEIDWVAAWSYTP